MTSEYLGARASNAGDDYHELWAVRHAIRLLSNENGLEAITVEGVGAEDDASSNGPAWDAVDCALFFGGRDCRSAKRIVIEQLKYSAASPGTPWTTARITYGRRPEQSVIGKLAKAWAEARRLSTTGAPIEVVLVSNQLVDPGLLSCVAGLAAAAGDHVWQDGTDEQRFAKAAGLDAGDLAKYCAALRFNTGAGSRFSAEERIIADVAAWAESDIMLGVSRLRQFIRDRMRPEHAGAVIERDAVLLHFGAYKGEVLFPAPASLSRIENPVRRSSVGLASDALKGGKQFVALHGQGGIGKTTALQQIEGELPTESVMVVYDCYGGGTYQDPSTLRHRPEDFYVQLINETATRLQLPLILTKSIGDDLPRLFRSRLQHAATSLRARSPNALLVIAVDAADNALVAAESRGQAEKSFVLDFVKIEGIPANVRFIVSARTGRLDRLDLPLSYERMEIKPFERAETGEFVKHRVSADDTWIDDFHRLSNGIPRVQTYALGGSSGDLAEKLNRLRPYGKHLNDVFLSQRDLARRKSGVDVIRQLCSGLLALARPIPVEALADILGLPPPQVVDVCSDLNPGLRTDGDTISFADEDFEDFLRAEAGGDAMPQAHSAVANWMLDRCTTDPYAAMHVAQSLVAAGRGADLLALVEREPAPAVIADTVLRREAEVLRLRLAVNVCRSAGDALQALKFVLRGADGLKTEAALREILAKHLDMSAAFAPETAGRLLLAVPGEMEKHGGYLFHRLAVDAHKNDAYAVREGRRRLRAWLDARRVALASTERPYARGWNIESEEIASEIEATLICDGANQAIAELEPWRPWTVALEVALYLPSKLIAQGRSDLVQSVIASQKMGPIGRMLCAVPLALAGKDVPSNLLDDGLVELLRRRPGVKKFFEGHHSRSALQGRLLETALTAFELLCSRDESSPAGDRLLAQMLEPNFRRIDRLNSFQTDKLTLLLRAFTLAAVRNGTTPSNDRFFEPRPAPSLDPSVRRRVSRRPDQENDQGLKELVGLVFDVYAARAQGLTKTRSQDEVDVALAKAVSGFSIHDGRMSRRPDSMVLRTEAAVSLLALLGTGYAPRLLKQRADLLHWSWINGGLVPAEEYVRTLALREELHADLARDLIQASSVALTVRISASEKSNNLVKIARLLNLVSPDDANAVFNEAVEGAAHIDNEAFAQISLLESLTERGHGHFESREHTSNDLCQIVADACVRLRDYDGFPWDAAMGAMARLDGPRALADAARWDDDAIARLEDTLPVVLQTGMRQGWLPVPHAAALACLVDGDYGVVDAALENVLTPSSVDSDKLNLLTELAAKDSLTVYQHDNDTRPQRLVERAGGDGPFGKALLAQASFLRTLPRRQRETAAGAEPTAPDRAAHEWKAEELVNADVLWAIVKGIQAQESARYRYADTRQLLDTARQAVPLRQRGEFLNALSNLIAGGNGRSVAHALVDAGTAWHDSPAIQSWCKSKLPGLITSNLIDFSTRYRGEDDFLSTALRLTGLPDAEQVKVILGGIEAQVNRLDATHIFELVRVAGGLLEVTDAAALASWYARRLADRIPDADRQASLAPAQYPADLDSAIARLLFALMGDFDLRQRWRAGHAARRLAHLGCTAPLKALVPLYECKDVPAFRSADVPFYWLAARLWFVIAWERIAYENPAAAAIASETLLRIALDESFPHLLIRSSARDACLALMGAGWVPEGANIEERVRKVNVTPFVPEKRVEKRRTRSRKPDKDHVAKFDFDSTDTIPYWFDSIVTDFAHVDMRGFTSEAERWIIDVWGYSSDVRIWNREARRQRLERYDWQLTHNGHGSLPTVERLSTHLEWHSMWCAAGELLKTEPLASHEYEGGGADTLERRADRALLTESPIWAADLLTPTPLIQANWLPNEDDIAVWTDAVTEADHRAELFPDDRPDYVVVEGQVERWTGDRSESISVSSALCDMSTVDSLLRALQTMERAHDYKLPEEGEDEDIDSDGFKLVAWLARSSQDGGLDRKDATRKAARRIEALPGRLVRESHHLVREGTGRNMWRDTSQPATPPMFVHELWGREVQDQDRYGSNLVVSGHRLLVHREQLMRFLKSIQMDLVVEVEVDRRGRTEREFVDEEEPPEGQFDCIYRLGGDAELATAEGRFGTWVGDSQRA